MHSKVVAILETRTGAHLGDLIARKGGVALLAPALEEQPDVDPQQLAALLEEWRRRPFDMVIFQTGVGTRAWFAATEELGASAELLQLLAAAVVVVRGPKPTGELSARGVRIDVRAPSPFTTDTLLEAVASVALAGRRVLVQRYGAPNEGLRAALEARGAQVAEVVTYKWALPADPRPLRHLLGELAASRVDAVVFTSAVQVHNLFAVAAQQDGATALPRLLQRSVIASIGPVCTRALQGYGIVPTFEASPPKLGPLVAALEAALRATP